jgi:hypothetical protein
MRTTTKSDFIGKGGGGEDCVCMEHDAIHRSKLHWEWYAVKNATSLPPEAMAIESNINSDQPHKV